jgi:ubiquinone/menaquinone biosynthesis C-methylase UbiE
MLSNLVNSYDFERLARKLREGQIEKITNKVRIRGTTNRVVASWTAVNRSPSQWWDIPRMTLRWNNFASGDPTVSFPQHVAKTWLGSGGMRALSLGCGAGGREVAWAKIGVFSQLMGVDISPDRIAHASRSANEAGLDSVLTFCVADARQMLHNGDQYDVVLGLHALHHFDKLDETMDLIARLLRPGGLLIMDEFVGPTKFQWTAAQLQAANALLGDLPPARRIMADGRTKYRVIRPSLLSMRLDDPSEAVESGNLLPAFRRRFNVLEERPYGGTVLHIALSGIAQNFLDDSPETEELLKKCFEAEDAVLADLGHDFVYMVGSPKGKLSFPAGISPVESTWVACCGWCLR